MTDQEAASTLGTVADSLSAARAGDSSAVAPDALLRISYVLAIFRAINTLLPLPESADTWMQEKQIQPPFLGRRAIDMLASGNAAEIASLRAYLKDGLDG
ncbi:MAG: hypothetical protein ABIS51_23370 [Sphingomonas sp.]